MLWQLFHSQAFKFAPTNNTTNTKPENSSSYTDLHATYADKPIALSILSFCMLKESKRAAK